MLFHRGGGRRASGTDRRGVPGRVQGGAERPAQEQTVAAGPDAGRQDGRGESVRPRQKRQRVAEGVTTSRVHAAADSNATPNRGRKLTGGRGGANGGNASPLEKFNLTINISNTPDELFLTVV